MTDWEMKSPHAVTVLDWISCCLSFSAFKELVQERTAIAGSKSWHQGFAWGRMRQRRIDSRSIVAVAEKIDREPLGLFRGEVVNQKVVR